MNQNVDINEVKKYNALLKEYQQKASQVQAGIEYNTKELQRLCDELTRELGVTVTPENVAQIRDNKLKEIENNLMVGNQILERIKNEEAIANRPVQQPQPQVQAQVQAQAQQMPPVPQAPQTPPMSNPGTGISWGTLSGPDIKSDDVFSAQPAKPPVNIPSPPGGIDNIPPMFGSL